MSSILDYKHYYLYWRFLQTVEQMLGKDISDNKAIGAYGAEAILKNITGDGPIQILTHCNTGSLATAGLVWSTINWDNYILYCCNFLDMEQLLVLLENYMNLNV